MEREHGKPLKTVKMESEENHNETKIQIHSKYPL